MKTLTGITLAGALAASLFAPFAANAQDIELTYLTHWSPETVALLEKAAGAYSSQHPGVTVSVRAVPFGDLLTTIRSGGAPTIASIYDLWLPELVRDGLVAQAPEAVAKDVQANWSEGIAAAAGVKGTIYGIPNEINVYALNYNKALFKEAGIEKPPATWAEFKDAAAKLTKKNGDQVTQQGFGFINSWAAGVVHPFASLLASNGGNLIEDGKPKLDSQAAKETFELYDTFVKDGYSVPAMGTADANTTGPFLDNFVSGKTGMIIMANWWESALKAGMGDKFADIGTAPIPVGPSGDKAHSISYSWMTVVNASASDAERTAAWDFLAWLNGQGSGEKGASAMADILQSMGILPSRTSDIAAYKDALGRPFLEGYVASLADARAFPVVLGGQEFSEEIQQTLEQLEYGKLSAADAQKNVQENATSILERAAQ
ncbi:extracellular solute-binding protein [Rhizobium sp. KVB221]|uniref:Extracellular solute-binding protein n=1 Tax=Rhizobium setariae TaxID=2801340 RepID=A0A936YUQ8_9HYPH|nr:extracellular solute-binding protein [Rhizobium setariae]MBL0373377.1 extracellular solute-binding protein [Rhizobium setariae]